jgi:hypothetical protein
MKRKLFIILILGFGTLQLFANTPQTSENTFLFCLKSTVQPLEIIRNGNEVIVNIDELNSAFRSLQVTNIEPQIKHKVVFDMGFDIYREGLEKYGELVWGRDAWVERLPDDHPAYFSYFSIPGGLPEINIAADPDRIKREAAQPMQGLFIGDRLAGVMFNAFASQGDLPGTTVGGGTDPFLVVDKETIRARNAQRSDPRLRQMVVNLVVFALTQARITSLGVARADRLFVHHQKRIGPATDRRTRQITLAGKGVKHHSG